MPRLGRVFRSYGVGYICIDYDLIQTQILLFLYIFAIISLIMSESLVQQPIEPEPTGKYQGLESLLDKVNGEGRFQKISFAIFNSIWFVTSWLLLGMSFFFDNDFTCNQSIKKDECIKYVCAAQPSQRINRMASYPKSIVFEFKNFLICQDFGYMITILQSMLFVGGLLGFLIIPYIADNFGRRKGILISWFIATLGVAIVALATSPNMVGIGYFFAGFGSNPAITLCYSFLNQQFLGKSRQRFGVAIQVFLALGESTIGLIFLSEWGWRNIFYLLLGLCVCCLCCLFYLIQTPFFLAQRDPDKTLQAFNKIAKINKRRFIKQCDIDNVFLHQKKNDSNHSIIDLFKYKSLRWISISSGLIFLGIQTIYYSTSLNLGSAGYNKYINQEIIGVSEMLGYISAQFIVHKIKRRKATFLGMGISSAMCALLAVLILFENEQNRQLINLLQTIGLIINRLVLCSFWSIFYVYVGELYPSKVRSLGFGWTSLMGTIGSTLSPYIILVSDSLDLNSWIPPALIGFFAWSFTFCLPESFELPLKDEIEEKKIQNLEDLLTGKDSEPEPQNDVKIG